MYVKQSELEPLSFEREQELAKQLFEEDDLEAARLLVTANLRFVLYIAHSYSGYKLPFQDIVQEGNVGLMKAVKAFDPNRNVRLSTFAVKWIRSEIMNYILKNFKIAKIATTKIQRKLFFNLRRLRKGIEPLKHEEATSISKELGVEIKDVYQMENRFSMNDASFSSVDDDSEEFAIYPEKLLFKEEDDPCSILNKFESTENNKKFIMKSLSKLDERSKYIIYNRWIEDKDRKMTLKELSEHFGVSSQRINQIEKKALIKMKGEKDVSIR
jgi:RNA polymerase sigma-32 factor